MNAPPKPNMEDKTNAPGFMSKLESKMRGTSDTYEYEGEKGMEKSADLIDNVGTVLKATGIGTHVGEAFSLMSFAMKTGLDFKNKSVGKAVTNAAIRLGTMGVARKIDKLTEIPNLVGKSIKEKATNLGTDIILGKVEGALTGDKKEKK